jgi:hypothetical protein
LDTKADVVREDHSVHDIDKELKTESKPELIIHDSCGFQASTNADDANEAERVKAFLRAKAKIEVLSDRLHVIW